MDSMDLDNDKGSLIQTFQALTLAADDHANASGDLEKAQIASSVTELLLRLQRLLSRCTGSVVSSFLSPAIFEQWLRQLGRTTSATEQYDLICDILKTCMAALTPQFILGQYSSIFAKFLSDSQFSAEAKEFLLKQISQILERADLDTINQLDNKTDFGNFLVSITARLSDISTSIAETSTKCLLSLCHRQPSGTTVLLSFEPVIECLQKMVTAKDIVRFRLYEFIGAVSIINEESLKLCADHGFVNALLKEIDSDDILCQMNAMEILTEMSGSDHCLRYFRDTGVLQKLNNMIIHAQQAPDATFLFPAVIKFFGHIARLYPKECCEGFPIFLSCVFDLVLNYNRLEVGQRLLAFDTLGMIGSTPDGKLILANHGDVMKKCMLCFGNSFKQGPVELRVRHIEALGCLIELQVAEQTPQLLASTEHWFSMLESSNNVYDSCKLFFDLFRQPFPEVHLAAGKIFKKLALQPWGRRLMAGQAGFLEYILNRTTEHTTEGRYVKFEIIKCLAESTTTTDGFEPPDILRLKEYVRDGPFYVEAQAPDVAFEEA